MVVFLVTFMCVENCEHSQFFVYFSKTTYQLLTQTHQKVTDWLFPHTQKKAFSVRKSYKTAFIVVFFFSVKYHYSNIFMNRLYFGRLLSRDFTLILFMNWNKRTKQTNKPIWIRIWYAPTFALWNIDLVFVFSLLFYSNLASSWAVGIDSNGPHSFVWMSIYFILVFHHTKY